MTIFSRSSRPRTVALLALSLFHDGAGLSGGEWPGLLVFESPSRADFSFGGPVGERFERNIANWLIPAPGSNPGMVEMFRVRDRSPAPAIVPWAGEFAGKYLLSAIPALRLENAPRDLALVVERLVREVMSSQAEDGYLGPFPRKERLLGNWDLWGHYHLIQALLLWNEAAGDEGALRAAVRAGDLICKTYLDSGRRAFDAGSQEMNLAVIHGLGMLYRRTGEGRYLRMMREIEKDWERSGDYFRQGLAGIEFFRTPRPRWESLHDLQGLVELYRITGDGRYRTAFANLWRSIARLDRHNTGGFSSGEQAVGHPYSPAPIETCCTVAWMAITADMLRLTGEPGAADELELSTLNGGLGAQHPSGRWWTYSTPMDGVREASAHTIVFQARAGTPELNCCSVNGPRALGMLPEWAVLLDRDGPIVNCYGPMTFNARTAGGASIGIKEETGYPMENRIKIILDPRPRGIFDLRLRIPWWSRETRITSPDGKVERPEPGKYHSILREWGAGETVTIDFDFRLRIWAGDREAAGKISIYRGPLLLAYDQRWNPFDEDGIPALDARAVAGSTAEPEPPLQGLLAPWLLVKLQGADGREIRLCDFASAGAAGTRYRSWLPAANVPPPPVVLDRPRDGERIPPGKAVFTWGGRRRSRAAGGYTLLISPSPDFAQPAAEISVNVNRAVLEKALEAGKDHFWKVIARNAHGTSESEARSFRVDPDLPPLSEAALGAGEPGPGGLLVAAALRGDPAPSTGALIDSSGIAPAPGPSGSPAGAVAFDGERGRIRYAVPFFPERDFTALVRVAPKSFPEGRIAQILSAWAKSMDDPLRITVEGGKVFARIEAQGRSFSTEGFPLRPGMWVHLGAVKRGPWLSLFVDGEEKGSVLAPEEVDSDAESVALGGNPNYGGNEFLPASMADFALYARALSPEEIGRLSR